MTNRSHSLFPAAGRRDPSPAPSVGQVFLCIMSTFCFVLILRSPETAVLCMGRGLSLCARTVIPSVFPFMVLSELLVVSGAGEAFGKLFSRFMKRLFGLSGAGVSAVILGSMCGFPVGARTAVSLFDRHMISKSECEHLLTFTSNPSSAFLLTAVGVSLFGRKRIGILLYATVLGTALFIGFLARFFLRGKGKPAPHPHFPSGLRKGSAEMFTGAVSSAATGMITVCAYVVFFSTVTGILKWLIDAAGGMPPALFALLCGFLELTGGVEAAAALSDPRLSLVLTAAIAGWSGLSVHCQILTLCAGRGLSLKPYLFAKCAQSVLSAAVMTVIVRCMGDAVLLPAPETVVETLFLMGGSLKDISVPAVITDGLFITGWVISRLFSRRQVGEI